jgi:hypothetical protein
MQVLESMSQCRSVERAVSQSLSHCVPVAIDAVLFQGNAG